MITVHPAYVMALEDVNVDLSFATSVVEVGPAKYPIGYLRLLSNDTALPLPAPRDLEIKLLSDDPSIAFVPSRVVIPAGKDYVQFEVEVNDIAGETKISAMYGDHVSTKSFRTVDTANVIDDIKLVINLASDKMQVGSEMPFSVYLEENGNIMKAPNDIQVKLDYESSLVNLSSDSLVIKKGSYYAISTIQTLEKSGNAFIRATSAIGASGKLDTVANVMISQTQPVSLSVHVFPEKVGLNENTIDIFVGVLDNLGRPTLAAEDIELELFSSAYQLSGISSTSAVIKKGEYGFYTRQNMHFFSGQNVTIGASSPGLGAGSSRFEVLEDSLDSANAKALDRAISVFTVGNMPSDAISIMTYQIGAIEHDNDDCVEEDGSVIEGATLENDANSGLQCVDVNGDGVLDEEDRHPIDKLEEGEIYPLESVGIYSQNQGNLNIVSSDNLAAKVISPGAIASGSSYGTALLLSGRQADHVDMSVSLSNFAVGSDALEVVGGLNPTQTKIFSPGGYATDAKYRILFDHDGFTDLFLVALDSVGRPSNSEQGIKYLVKPVNGLAEINPGTSFANIHLNVDSFMADNKFAENTIEEINAVPVGVNADSELEVTTAAHLLFNTGIAVKTLLPFNNLIAFSEQHSIGLLQLQDMSENPVPASEDVWVRITSSSPSSVLSSPAVIIPKGKSLAYFNVTTFGRADNLTIYGAADGFQSSSAILTPILATLDASFLGDSEFKASIPASIKVSTPLQGATVVWGVSSGLKLLSNTSAFVSTGNSYVATMEIRSDDPGTFTVDAMILKDGFKPTRISKEVTIGTYFKQMNAVLLDNGKMLAYNQPTMMQVSVKDANGKPISGASIQVEDTAQQGLTLVTTAITDANGVASFVYTPMKGEGSLNVVTLMVTAFKDGYQPSRDSKVFEMDGSTAVLPPIPIIGGMFTGLPSWTSYLVLGGIAAVGGGLYFLKRPKSLEGEEALVEEVDALELKEGVDDQSNEMSPEGDELDEDEEN